MFQTEAEIYPALGRAGQPAATTPIIAAGGGEMSFRAGATGLDVAKFAWRDATDPTLLNNTGTAGLPVGFIQNVLTATIVDINDGFSMHILPGREVTAITGGDFWAVSTTAVTIGQKVFATLADGTIATGAAGATVAGAIETEWTATTEAAVGEIFIMSTWSKA